MPHTILFEREGHKNVLLEDVSAGNIAVQANQHLIIHGDSAMLLDPGGHKVYSKVLSHVMSLLGRSKLRHLFLSHQDPDIVAAVNGWLMTTDAEAWVSKLWVRFVPHFGLDRLVESRLRPIGDEGTVLDLAGAKMIILPAHFLHSPGNFQVYDPLAKILYSGDLGASIETPYVEVPDFDQHIQYMLGFHQRYMASNRAMKTWANTVRKLDIETIAPQHGAVFRGREMVSRFVNWCDTLQCGTDLIHESWSIPGATTP